MSKKECKNPYLKYTVYVFLSFLLTMQIIGLFDSRTKSMRDHNVLLAETPIYVGDSTGYGLQGESFSLKQASGEFTILAFWAPWCGYCKEEFPHMDEAAPYLAEMGVNIIPIVRSTEPQSDIENFYKKLDLNNIPPLVSDDRALYAQLQVKGYPAFFIANSKSEVIAKARPDWEGDNFERVFRDLSNLKN